MRIYRKKKTEVEDRGGYIRETIVWTTMPLQATNISMGLFRVEIPPNGVIKAHYHAADTEVFFFQKGKCLVGTDTQKADVEAGDVLVAYPGEVHWFKPIEGKCIFYTFRIPCDPKDKVEVEAGGNF